MSVAPTVTHVLETALYVADLQRSQDFYQSLFGFHELLRDNRMCALAVPGQQVLLLFHEGASIHPSYTPFGKIPPHDTHGTQHVCFAISEESWRQWEERLAAADLAIESRLVWPQGAVSIYFRDPDGHSIELSTPKLWPNYPG